MKNILFGLVSCLSILSVAHADVWSERQALAKVQSELNSLLLLVSVAKDQSVQNSRMHFDYSTLEKELNIIKSGIGDHLADPMDPVMPDNIVQIDGAYTVRNK
ncbi:MAG: RAQPRD family integrative conjugative element protein [Methylococcales bacterium]